MEILKKVKILPKSINPNQLKLAIKSFIKQSHITDYFDNEEAVLRQTVENIAASTIYKRDESQSFWIYEKDNKLLGFALTNIGKESDGELAFWITKAWADPSVRNTGIAKQAYKELKEEAKRNMCKYIIIPSSRKAKVYQRFLGQSLKQYIPLLKEDL